MRYQVRRSAGEGGPDMYTVHDRLERRVVATFTREPLAEACARRLDRWYRRHLEAPPQVLAPHDHLQQPT